MTTNFNCGVNLGEDEFALLGKARALMPHIMEAHSQQHTEAPEFNVPHILCQLRMGGLGNFAEENGIGCIKLRAALPKKVADLFCNAKWKVDRGGVRVRT